MVCYDTVRPYCIITTERARAVKPGLPETGFPRQGRGELRMDRNEKGRSLYEWTALIAKLLGAVATLLAVVADFFR